MKKKKMVLHPIELPGPEHGLRGGVSIWKVRFHGMSECRGVRIMGMQINKVGLYRVLQHSHSNLWYQFH